MALYNYIIQRRIKIKVLILSMMKHLLFIMTMVCCLCCNSFHQDPTVKIRQSVAKDTLLKSFGILYSDLNKEKIIYLNKRISCMLQPVATSNKEENNYFRLKINKDKHTVCIIDSIISIGKIQYNSKTTRIIIPITKDQNAGDFSTTGEILCFDSDELVSDCIEKNLINSEAVCFSNSGLFCLYISADTLFTYNFSTKEKKAIFIFDIPMMYSVELKLKNNILTLLYYSNFVEDFEDFNPAKIATFDYHE